VGPSCYGARFAWSLVEFRRAGRTEQTHQRRPRTRWSQVYPVANRGSRTHVASPNCRGRVGDGYHVDLVSSIDDPRATSRNVLPRDPGVADREFPSLEGYYPHVDEYEKGRKDTNRKRAEVTDDAEGKFGSWNEGHHRHEHLWHFSTLAKKLRGLEVRDHLAQAAMLRVGQFLLPRESENSVTQRTHIATEPVFRGTFEAIAS
jgi:hypothetical protein